MKAARRRGVRGVTPMRTIKRCHVILPLRSGVVDRESRRRIGLQGLDHPFHLRDVVEPEVLDCPGVDAGVRDPIQCSEIRNDVLGQGLVELRVDTSQGRMTRTGPVGVQR